MTRNFSTYREHKFSLLSKACSAAFVMFVIASPVYATDDDPFAMDTSHWMSFDHYKENTRFGRKTPDATPPVEPQMDTNSTDAATQAATKTPAATPVAAVATPSRPVNLPVMPGLNKGFNIEVKSTEEDSAPAMAVIKNMDTTPSVEFRDSNWQQAAEAARQIHKSSLAEDGDEEAKPLDIRMSFLPNVKVAPADQVAHNHSTRGRNLPQSRPVPPVEEAKKPADLASCQAIDAYKKQQLQAIQTDRQTLAALQDAIAHLGLQKQLSFLSDAQGNLNTEAANASVKADPLVEKSAQP